MIPGTSFTSTFRPTSSASITPPTLKSRRNPFSSTLRTMQPMMSECAATISFGPGAPPSFTATTFPCGSTVTESASAPICSANTRTIGCS